MTKGVKDLSRKSVYKAKHLTMLEERYRISGRPPARHYTLDHPGAVVIVPQAKDGSLMLVRQYRHSVRRQLLEFPAGTLERGERPLACAKREICEEIGFAARRWRTLGKVYPAPGFCNELQYLYFATDLHPRKLQQDDDEWIEVVPLSPRQVERAIASGRIRDSKSISAFFLARQKKLF